MFYIVRYRRKLVYQNMKDSFPEKSEKETRRMEKAFYHTFCDYIVETIKLLHISDKETRKRVKFHNTEALQEIVDNGGFMPDAARTLRQLGICSVRHSLDA